MLDILCSRKEAWIDSIMMSKRDGKCLPVQGHSIVAFAWRIHVEMKLILSGMQKHRLYWLADALRCLTSPIIARLPTLIDCSNPPEVRWTP